MVIDMGMHKLSNTAGSHLLVQITIPTLEERARSDYLLKTLMLQPGESEPVEAAADALVGLNFHRFH